MTIEPGARIPPFVMDDITMDRIHMIMDLMHDTNPVHDDPELVERRKLRGPVNQGPANLSYILNMLHAWAGAVWGAWRPHHAVARMLAADAIPAGRARR